MTTQLADGERARRSVAVAEGPQRRVGHSGRFAGGWQAAAAGAVLVGVVLRLIQFAARPSIWVDEAALARSILDRNLSALLSQPLNFGQVAPPGFLVAVKWCANLAGTSEYVLRLVPLIAGIAAVGVFHRVARRVLSPPAAAIATLLFAVAPALVLFSSNLKPYSSDVLATLAVLLAADVAVGSDLTWALAAALALVGIVGTVMSTAAVFTLGPGAAALLWRRWRGPDALRRWLIAGCWGLAAAGAALWARRALGPVDRAYMELAWAPGFAPANPIRMLPWLWHRTVAEFGGGGVFGGTLQYAAPTVVGVVAAVGAVAVGWRHRPRALLLLGPLAAVLLASVLHQYPFEGRVVLFVTPLLILLTVAGAEAAGGALFGARGATVAVVLVAPLGIAAALHTPVPQFPEHLRPVLAYVHDHYQPGDRIWVYYGAGQAFRFYQRQIPLEATVSDCRRDEPRDQLRQVDALRGAARAWVIVAHARGSRGENERVPLIDYLERIGTRRDQWPQGVSRSSSAATAVAYLFSLDDRSRLAGATADTFPIAISAAPRWTCYGPMAYDQSSRQQFASAVLEARRLQSTGARASALVPED